MEKILGLDLGTNSIGLTIRNPYKDGNQLEKYTVMTFQKGVGEGKSGEFSFAAERTKKRSVRRLYQARKYRLWETLRVLIENDYCPLKPEELDQWSIYDKKKRLLRKYPVNAIEFEQWVKLDFNGDGKPDYISPHQLRKELIEQKLDLNNKIDRHKIGRAFYHIAQRRGFKSSRKTGQNENNSVYEGSEKSGAKGVNDIRELIEKYGTLGAALAYIETTGERVRNQYTLRSDYLKEAYKICEVQGISTESKLFKDLIEKEPKKENGAIFYKRPLRSQKGLIGKCTLESNKPRCPVNHPLFEEFRALAFLNNIQFKPINDKNVKWQSLPLELKEQIYNDKFFRKSKDYFPFSEIREYIIKNNYNWVLNYKDSTTVSGCPVSARLKDIFGNDWKNFKINTGKTRRTINKNGLTSEHSNSYCIEDIWHVLFSFDDEELVGDFAKVNLEFKDEEKIKEFKKAWKELPDGYGMLSLNAIKKIVPFLRKGFIYTEAVLLANMPTVLGEELWEENKNDLEKAIKDIISNNRNEKQLFNIANNLIAKWYSLENENKFGYKNLSYQLDESDKKEVLETIIETLGKQTWEKKSDEEKNQIILKIEKYYQDFFKSEKREFYKLPHLLYSVKEFLRNNFKELQCQNPESPKDKSCNCKACKKINKLYHPSQIEIYRKAKEDKEGKILLGSPKTGAFKNPMAMRTLHELRKLINYLLLRGEIDSDTRIVVELARELNDSNKRWAIETYQKRREEENKEFENALTELLKDPEILKEHPNIKADSNNDDDIDKFRLWYEQIEHEQIFKKEPTKNKIDKDGKEIETYDLKKHDWNNIRNKIIQDVVVEKDLIKKYRLWKEQGCRCIYTGKIIKLTDLFDENVVDFEHTIPRSISFDNSLANLTVCYASYNRNIKKKRIPTELENYESDWSGYTAIKPRLEDWNKKVEGLETNIEFWKKKSKKSQNKEDKDYAIRQRHLWQFELDYWKNKLDRFTKTEVTSGFKNSQLIDTQLISKYALHYLRTVFNIVDVQKGSITAEFRKIYGIQPKAETKDRSKHSHHAIDAAVLTLIPSASKREEILKSAYEYEENNWGKQYHVKPYNDFNINHIQEIENNILANYIVKDQTLTPAKKIVRKRGKIVYLRDKDENLLMDDKGKKKPKIAQGESIRGKLHQETFLGAIKKVKRDENGNIQKDDNKKFIFEDGLFYVVREPLVFKKDSNSPGFKSLKEIESCIVDPYVYKIIAKQVGDKSLKDAIEDGIWMLNKKAEKINRIRHIRIFVKDKNPLTIKEQTYTSTKKIKYLVDRQHKKFYYAGNSENILYGFYTNGKDNKFKCRNIFELTEIRKTNEIKKLEDFFEPTIKVGKSKKEIPLYCILKVGQKVIFYNKDIDEIKSLDNTEKLKRLYKINILFSAIDGRIQFQYHLEARPSKELGYGDSKIDFNNLKPRYLLSPISFNFLIEGKDFEVKPDGEIIFKW